METEFENFIGKKALIPCSGIKVEVKIISTRVRVGRHELLVKPLKGQGEKWITRNNMEVIN